MPDKSKNTIEANISSKQLRKFLRSLEDSTKKKNKPKKQQQLPTVGEFMSHWYRPGVVFNPKLNLKPIIFDNNKSGVRQLNVSISSAFSQGQGAFRMLHDEIQESQ